MQFSPFHKKCQQSYAKFSHMETKETVISLSKKKII